LNSRLKPMNTTTTSFQTLRPGQALALPARLPKSLVLVEGEVLVQAPAQWLGGTLVLSKPVRFAAPQSLPVDDGAMIIAGTRARLAMQASPSPVGALRALLGQGFLRPHAA
jgi:hypothetical protein